MRTKALILFIPFLVFLMETASFVPGMDDACAIVAVEKPSCSKEKKKNPCAVKKEKSCCSKPEKEDMACTKKGSSKEPSGNKCDNNPDCSSCPVCYTFIFQSQFEWTARQFDLTKDYRLLSASYTSAYTHNVWKPPNGLPGSL